MKKRPKYEQAWQKAFEPASVRPNPTVWAGIERALDAAPRNNGWLPLLLVAASISLAMALPLTIGDSRLPLEPHDDVLSSLQPRTTAPENSVTPNDADVHPQGENELYSDSPVTVAKPAGSMANEDKVPLRQGLNRQNKVMPEYVVHAEEPAGVVPGDIGNYYLSAVNIPHYLAAMARKVPVEADRPQLLAFNASGGSGSSGSSAEIGSLRANSFSDMAQSAPAAVTSASVGEGSRRATVVGVGFELPVGQRSALQFGLNYFNNSADGTSNRLNLTNTDMEPLAYSDYVDNGMIFTDTPYEYTVSDHYLNLPVIFKYPFLQRKFMIRGGLGSGIDILLNHSVKSASYGRAGYSAGDVGMSPVWLNGVVNVDFGYWIAPKYLLSFETGYRLGFGLGSSNSNTANYQTNFTIGIKLNYQIK
jgi:hypothetical protein